MMLALLLAQLVLPWPGLDSPLVQPPGMICLGACAGPVIYGPAEQRGRLVVACDMRSSTCSDGRTITTQRATPVPCETSPGVWEIIPADQGCYSVRGLESWAQTTSYLSHGAELDRSPWGGQATATKDGANYLVCGETGGAFRQQLASEAGGVVRAAACRVRAGTSNSIRLLAADVSSGGVNFDYTLTDAWQTVTATTTIVEGGGVAGVRLHPSRAGAGCVEVAGCWSTKSDTPGRPCWGGEAPVTCAGDRHTISTEGWPTTEGEISITFTVGESTAHRYIIDGRASGDAARSVLIVSSGGRLRLYRPDQSFVDGPAVTLGVQHVVRLRPEGERTKVFLDGVEVMDVSGTLSWAPTATLGMRYTLPDEALNGAISSLRVRRFE